MRQQRDFSIRVDLEDYTNKFITEAPITRERSAADVSLLLSATAQPVVQDLLDANNGSRTRGYVIILATEKLFGHGQEDDVSVMARRSFKLPRKIAGSNNSETQALAFADETLWLARLAWSEMHGASMRRWHLDENVPQVGGMLITDSRGIFDALTRSESPQLRLRSSRTSEEARGIKEQCAASNARIHWVNTLTLLADSLTKPGYPARAVMESFLVEKRWRCTFDPTFDSEKSRHARGAPLFNDEDLDDINPLTDRVAFDTLLQDESLSEDVRETMRMKYD